MMIFTRLESLSIELLLEIMEYLDVHNLILAFNGLNGYFNSLLQTCHLHVLIDNSKQDTNTSNRLMSFIDGSDESIHQRLSPNLGANLRTISLRNINKSTMQLIFERLPAMNQLKSLYIKNCWYPIPPKDDTIEEFIFAQHGHRLISLIRCSFWLMPYSSSFPSVTTIFPHLRRLSFNENLWTSDTVAFLVNNTPNLRSLRIRPYGKFSQVLFTTKTYVNHVRELEIRFNYGTVELSSLLILFPGLQRLRVVHFDTESVSAFDGRAWQKVIEEHLPQLQQMTLDFRDKNENEIDEQFVRSFYIGEFWLKKKVVTKPTMDQAMSQNRIVRKIFFGRPWTFDDGIEL